MTVADPLIRHPCEATRAAFREHVRDHDARTFDRHALFKAYSDDAARAEQAVPSLNACALHDIPAQSLVRFRCMIQDTNQTEMYLKYYEVQDANGPHLACHDFSDQFDFANNTTTWVSHSPQNQYDHRHVLYATSVPGENAWVASSSSSSSSAAVSSHVSSHVSSTEDGAIDALTTAFAGMLHDVDPKDREFMAQKFPFPGVDHKAAYLKVYEHDAPLLINTVIEVLGVIENTTEHTPSPKEAGHEVVAGEAFDEPDSARLSRHLIPHIHVVAYRPVKRSTSAVSEKLSDKASQRTAVLHTIDQTLQDPLLSEYLMLALLSKIYMRSEQCRLGGLSINVTRADRRLCEGMQKVVEHMMPYSHALALDLKTLNERSFVPKQDESGQNLLSGLLQVPHGLVLMLDETELETGELKEKGCRNVMALQKVLQEQKLAYEWAFCAPTFETDIIFFICSEGKSILKTDCIVPHVHTAGDRTAESAAPSLPLSEMRAFFADAAEATYDVGEDMAKFIQDEFVRVRREQAANKQPMMKDTDLLYLLNLARLVAISKGETTLTKATWSHANALEEKRTHLLATMHPLTAAHAPDASSASSGTAPPQRGEQTTQSTATTAM